MASTSTKIQISRSVSLDAVLKSVHEMLPSDGCDAGHGKVQLRSSQKVLPPDKCQKGGRAEFKLPSREGDVGGGVIGCLRMTMKRIGNESSDVTILSPEELLPALVSVDERKRRRMRGRNE